MIRLFWFLRFSLFPLLHSKGKKSQEESPHICCVLSNIIQNSFYLRNCWLYGRDWVTELSAADTTDTTAWHRELSHKLLSLYIWYTDYRDQDAETTRCRVWGNIADETTFQFESRVWLRLHQYTRSNAGESQIAYHSQQISLLQNVITTSNKQINWL